MPGITDHPDDFDRGVGLPQRIRSWRGRGRCRASLSFAEEIRRRAEVWLANEMTLRQAQFQPKMTGPPELL
jgi:hypothetical protein